ncbi:MAG: glycosyltransferase family 4 protein [Planctomycetes bacterium]|nr:glycosyltransferase family 4 protein [Planctomycetota bacterium]
MEIFRRLLALFPKACLMIGGALGEKEELERLQHQAKRLGIAQRVGYYTNVNAELRKRLYASADIFLSPVDNYQETFGLSILEAMSCSLPVVCSDWGGYRDLVDHGQDGFLLPTRVLPLAHKDHYFSPHLGYLPLEYSQCISIDESKMFEYLKTLLGSELLRKEMGENAVRKASAYTWDKIIGRYQELWERLARKQILREPESSFRLSQAELFASYPTVILGKDVKYELSDPAVVEFKMPAPSPFLAESFPRDAFMQILGTLKSHGEADLGLMASQGALRRDELLLSLAYLLKHHIIKIHS